MSTKSERTKQFIIEKTAPVFNSKGYSGTSMNDLTEVTGLTKGSIYGNFANKDEVAVAAFEYNFQLVVKHIRAIMDERNSIVDKLLVYPETYRNFFQLDFLSQGCPLANTSVDADDTHPLLKEKAAQALAFWRETLEFRLSSGVENGEIKASINIKEISSVLAALVQGAVLQAKVSGNMVYLNASMDFLENMIRNLRS